MLLLILKVQKINKQTQFFQKKYRRFVVTKFVKLSDENIKVLKKFAKSKQKSTSNFTILKSCKVSTKKKILREPEKRKEPKHVPNYRGSMHISVCVSKKAWLGAKIYPYFWAGLQNSMRILLETRHDIKIKT